MERLITFCVLIFHAALVAAFPFPEGYNLAYQQPQLQFPNYAQSQASIPQSRQQYGDHRQFAPEPSYSNLQYPSNPVQNSAYHNLINQEPAEQQRQNYANYLPRQPLQPPVPTQQQIKDQIKEQIQEQIHETLVNHMRIQNSQPQQLRPVSEPYPNIVPIHNSYPEVRNYQNVRPASQMEPLYLPNNQELPRLNPPVQWEAPSQIQYESKPVEAVAQAQSAPEPVQRPEDPFKKVYNHYMNQQAPTNSAGNSNSEPWKNIWKKYATASTPPKHEKRYLIIHPDGSTEYVDNLDHITKKHPNYVLVNGRNVPLQGAPTARGPQSPAVAPQTVAQANAASPPGASPVATATAIASVGPPPQNPSSPPSPAIPISPPAAPAPPSANPPPAAYPPPTANPPPAAYPPPTANPPPAVTPSPTATPPPTATPLNKAPLPPKPKPPPKSTPPPTATSPPPSPPLTPPTAKPSTPLPPGSPPSATPPAVTPPSLTTSMTPPPTKTPNTPSTPTKPTTPPQTPPQSTPPAPNTPPTKTTPTTPPPPTTTVENKPTTPPSAATPKPNSPTSTTPAPPTRAYAASPTLPSPTTTAIPPTKPTTPAPKSGPPKSTDSITPAPPTKNTKRIPSKPPKKPPTISFELRQPVAAFKLSDSDALSTVIGNDPEKLVLFFVVKPETKLEKDVKTTLYPDGTALEEITETLKENDYDPPKVMKTVRLIPAPANKGKP